MKISAMDLEDQFLILESHHRFKPTVRKMASFELWCWYMPSQELQKQFIFYCINSLVCGVLLCTQPVDQQMSKIDQQISSNETQTA